MYSALFMQNEPNSGWSRTGHRGAGHAGNWHAEKLGSLRIRQARPARHGSNPRFFETIAKLPGELGLIPIAEALKSATSRTGGKPNVIARGPEPCSPGISWARSRIGPGYLATVSVFQVTVRSVPVPQPGTLAVGSGASDEPVQADAGTRQPGPEARPSRSRTADSAGRRLARPH